MFTVFFIARNNLKRKKNDAAVITALILLATILLYFSSSVLGNIYRIIDKAHDDCNNADYMYITSSSGAEIAKEYFEESGDIKEYEISPIYYLNCKYYTTPDEEKKEYMFLISSIEEEVSINKINVKEQGKKKSNSILLPYYLHVNNSYEIGDPFFMEINNHTYEFEIMGFTENPMYASPLNISMYRCYIPQIFMDQMLHNDSNLQNFEYQECKVLLNDGADASAYLQPLTAKDHDTIFGVIYETMKFSIAMMPQIVMTLMLVFSAALLAIALIVIRFSVKNFIEENLKNIGILQAAGYTTGQLRFATCLEIFIVTILGCLFGLLICILSNPSVGTVIASIMGLRYNVGFDWKYMFLTIDILFLVIFLITFLSSRTYKKIPVLDALRGGIHTHNFKKNILPLEKTPLPVNFVLGMKHIFGMKLKHFGILFIVAVLSFSCCLGFSLYENFAKKTDTLLKLTGVETGTAIISGENLKQIGEEMEQWREVKKINYAQNLDIVTSKENQSMTIACDV